MNKKEIKDFKDFLQERSIYLMFERNYRTNRLTVNPPDLEDYLEKTRADSIIPQAFLYPKTLHGRDFWLAVNEEWTEHLSRQREEQSEEQQLNDLDLEIIDIPKRNLTRIPKNTCSLNMKYGRPRLTLNKEHSQMVAKKLSTHLLLTRNRQTKDVVLMFNRSKGIEVHFSREGSLTVCNVKLAAQLVKLLDLDPDKDYFYINIELLTETKDFLLFMLKGQ